MKQPLEITLSMIVKNEENYLRECLESVEDIVDEIIVVDTGSTDNTVNIAKEFHSKIYNYKWINDFSAARNFALSKSTGEWILYLDADERLSKNSIKELKNTTSKNEFFGCRCMVNNLDDINGKPKFMRYTRLFRNSTGIRFSGKVHEQIDDSLLENNYRIIDTDIEIIHTGYNVSDEILKQKAERNLKILKDEFQKNKTSYNAYQLANTYSVLEDFENANRYYRIAVNGDLNKEYIAFCYLNLSDYEFKKHRLDQAVEFLGKGLKLDPSSPLLNLLASDIFFRLNKLNESLGYCKKAYEKNKIVIAGKNHSALAIGIKNEMILSKGVYYSFSSGSSETEYFLSELKKENSELTGIVKEIIENKKISGPDKNDLRRLVSNNNLDMILEVLGNYKEKPDALEILESLKDSFKDNSRYLRILGLLYLENNMQDNAAVLFEESLAQAEKDPASVFYLVSIYLQNNQADKIPALLIMAEKEFSSIPEFKTRFEILKQKLNSIFR